MTCTCVRIVVHSCTCTVLKFPFNLVLIVCSVIKDRLQGHAVLLMFQHRFSNFSSNWTSHSHDDVGSHSAKQRRKTNGNWQQTFNTNITKKLKNTNFSSNKTNFTNADEKVLVLITKWAISVNYWPQYIWDGKEYTIVDNFQFKLQHCGLYMYMYM